MSNEEKKSEVQIEESQDIDYSSYDDLFIRRVGIEQLVGLPQREGWHRKAVITNYPAAAGPDLVRNYENHRKIGYTPVISTEKVRDDRLFSPNSNTRETTAPKPLTGKTSDGFDYIVMEIPVSRFQEEFKARDKAEYEKYLASVRGSQVKGNETFIQDYDTKLTK